MPAEKAEDRRAPDGPLLVLGAGGFLGAHVLRIAAVKGRSCVGAARAPERLPAPLDALGLDVRRWDAEVLGDTERLLDAVRPERIVLAAAAARPGACEADPGRAERLNVSLPETLARSCAERGTRLVHVSTDLVFAGEPPRDGGYVEEDPTDPVHVYGRTKAAGEARVLAADPSALVVRLPLLFGDSGGRAEGASDGILHALEAGAAPTLFIDEWRTPCRSRTPPGRWSPWRTPRPRACCTSPDPSG